VVLFDPKHPFWTTHNIDPSTVRRTPTSQPRTAPTKRKGAEGGAGASKKSNTRVPFDPQHPFWTMHNIDPINVRRTPRTTFPDPQSTSAHPLRESLEEGSSTPRQLSRRTGRPLETHVPELGKRKERDFEGPSNPRKVSKPNPNNKRKAKAISKNLIQANANVTVEQGMPTMKARTTKPTTVRERAAAFEQAINAFPPNLIYIE
jgi:hypothetical protein